MLKYLAAAGIASLLLWPLGVPASPAWEQWQSVGGVFDLGGPRADGALVVAASGALYTLTSAGVLTRFAVAYHDDPGAEAYLAMSPGISAPACAFAPDDLFILRLHAPIGVTHVNADGTLTSPFTNVGASSLNGIAFDSVGGFSHDLLVTAPVNGKTEVAGIDCSGGVRVITRSAPVVEGGIAVAPQGFGQFGGDLIAPDELSGLIWAIAPDGSSKQVVNSGLPHGQDTGVESVAFVPAGFIGRGGFLYYSDRLTTGNPHPGSDHVLRLSSVDLVASGVQDGDLLAATEGGASMIDVRCAATCGVTRIVATPTTAHGEGHLVFAVSPVPASSPSARSVNQ
ncbi:MAG TPA: hypothetical protein VKE27_09580, partial [Candidatus Dormibacteraeota bacterium]|nr:hypothetical protein [Candidatus Dormibacteraeota bacterium]